MNLEDRSPAIASDHSRVDQDGLAMLALALTPNLGPKRIVDAMRDLKCPAQLFELTLTELEGLRFPADAAQFIFDGKARRSAEQEAEQLARQNATLITLASPAYPERLKEIYDPPPVLWVRGNVELLARPSVAIVGTRHPSPYGMQVAEMLARDLSTRRLVIVSGMARGIDTCAHRGALAARMPMWRCGGLGSTLCIRRRTARSRKRLLPWAERL